MSFQLLAGIMKINERGQEELRAVVGQGCSELQDRFAVTPGGSDKTSLRDAVISHQRLQTEYREREIEGGRKKERESCLICLDFIVWVRERCGRKKGRAEILDLCI